MGNKASEYFFLYVCSAKLWDYTDILLFLGGESIGRSGLLGFKKISGEIIEVKH